MKKILVTSMLIASTFSLGAHAAVIDFESDTTGDKANGWASVDDSGVHFTDTFNANLNIADYGTQGDGQSLAINGDDASKLQINFDFSIGSLSLDFGNDDSSYAQSGDRAWLEVFNSGVSVGITSVLMNLNDVMDQSIALSGFSFDSALFWYGNASGAAINLIEIVDNITYNQVNAVPIPAAAFLFAPALLGFMGLRLKAKNTVI